jgi:hypothetical protein
MLMSAPQRPVAFYWSRRRLGEGRGRPATGRNPMIGLRLPKDEIARLDNWAKANGYTRSEAIRILIKSGIGLDVVT